MSAILLRVDSGPKGRDAYDARLARKMAREHFELRLSASEIAELNGLEPGADSQVSVHQLINSALEDHLVDVTVDYVFNTPPLSDDELSRELARVAGLHNARVLMASADDVPSEGDRPRSFSTDQLHYRLGYLAAEVIHQMLRNGDRIAVGAGRGVAHTVRALRELAAERGRAVRGLEVFSLVGSMWVRIESMGRAARDYYIDSDQNALELAKTFQVPWGRVHLVWLPRVYATDDQAQYEQVVRLVAPHLRGHDWSNDSSKRVDRNASKPNPNIALSVFGVGVCNHEHYWRSHGGMQIEAVPEIRLLEELLAENPTAVIDICDRLHLRQDVLPDDMRKQASNLVAALDRRFLGVSFKKLNAAEHRCLIAGGKDKLDAMLEILSRGGEIGIQPTVVVTDDWTARALIERLPEQSRNGNE